MGDVLALRLLMLTQDFPPVVGGIQTYTGCLARLWSEWCDDFAVMAPAHPEDAAWDRQHDFDIFRENTSSDLFRIRIDRALNRLLKERHFDAVFTGHWYVARAAIAARKRGWDGQVFSAAHAQELIKNIFPRGLKWAYAKHRRHVCENLDGLYPVSRFTGELSKTLGVDPRKITVVPNGTDVERFSGVTEEHCSDFRQRYQIATDSPLIGTVCRLVSRKGIDTVLKALPGVIQRFPNLTYIVVGHGPDKERLSALVTMLNLTQHVRFLGKIPFQDLVPAYATLDCFVMPARQEGASVEGFGLVFTEASACGVPVIGGRSGGVPDAIVDQKSGFLVTPDSVPELTDRLVQLLSSRELRSTLGDYGKQHVREHGTWRVAARRIFDDMERKCALS